jgi:type I restriction-modification system DNA methylase subunit
MTDIRNEFKRIDNILFEDAGTNGANDYMAQMSWILFLKYLDDLEDVRKDEATLHQNPYVFLRETLQKFPHSLHTHENAHSTTYNFRWLFP